MGKKDKKCLLIQSIVFIVVVVIAVVCAIFIPKACQKKTEYKLDVACTNCSIDNQTELHNFYPENDVVTLTFKANDNYVLPDDVKATSGNKQLVKDTDYTYSKDTGVFTFTITADTEVNVDANYINGLRFEVKIPANEQVCVAFKYAEDIWAFDDRYPGTIDWGDETTDNKLYHTFPKTDEEKTYSVVAYDYTYDYFAFQLHSSYYEPSVITSVTLPNSIKTIGDYAFYYCTSLTSINIPNSVTSIGTEAFYDCSSLTSITIPNSVTSIGDYAFSYCSSLTSITIPNSVTSISGHAFYYCSHLTSITIPNSVTSIDGDAFYNINANAVVDMSDVDHLIPLTNDIFCLDSSGIKFEGTIKVKNSLLNDYKTADYWKNTADRFQGV